MSRRKRATRKERLTPCECCGYPLSQRHHLLEVARYGENSATAQLCANCHELYHLAYRLCVLKSQSAEEPFLAVQQALGNWCQQITHVIALVDYVGELKSEIDWELKYNKVDLFAKDSERFQQCVEGVLAERRSATEVKP